MRTVTCPTCGKTHKIDQATYNLFGVDCQCMKCVDWKHIDFMRANAKRLGMTCVEGCRCGYGTKG